MRASEVAFSLGKSHYSYFTRLSSTFTLRSSSPGWSTGVSAMKAEWAKRGSLSSRRKGFDADGALADLLMAVEFGAAGGLGVVHVPDADGFKADSGRSLAHGFLVALGRDQIVTGDVGVAGVQADAHGRAGLEPLNQLGDLLEAAAEGELRAGGVFNEDVEWSSLPLEAIDGTSDGVGGQPEAFVPGEPFHEPGCRTRNSAPRASARSISPRKAPMLFPRTSSDWLQTLTRCLYGSPAGYVELGTKFLHADGLLGIHFGSAPHARAGGEDLEGIGANLPRLLDGVGMRRRLCRDECRCASSCG